jgi:preprotein translocase subunit YajC
MLISPAYAQAAGGGGSADFLIQIAPLILIFVVFWFFLIRPQQQKAKQHRELVANLRRGDQVLTSGGIVGRVAKLIDDVYIQVEIAENIRVKLARASVSDVLTKGEPVKASAAKKEAREEDADESDDDKGGGAAAAEKPAAAPAKKPMFSFGAKK